MQTERDPSDVHPLHECTDPHPRPPGYELRTRDRLAMSRMGAMSRFRSWATVLVGLIALAICLVWLFNRWD